MTSRIFKVNLFLILATSIFLRVFHLQNVPGLNGDEAFYGNQMLSLLHGHPFSAVTPNGSRLNPFHSGVVLLLLRFFPPAYWILKIPEVVSGLLVIALGYRFVRKLHGVRTAIFMALLLASLPVLIAYSRLGWDPGELPLASLFLLYFAMQDNLLGALLSLEAACIIHPTGVLLLPVGLGPILALRWQKAATRKAFAKDVAWLGLFSVVFLGMHWFWSRGQYGNITGAHRGLPEALAQIPMYISWFARVFSGTTTFQYLTGSLNRTQAFLLPFIASALSLPVWILGTMRLWKNRQLRELGLLAGVFGSLLAFAVVFQPYWLIADNERYSLFCVVPVIWGFCLCLDALPFKKIWQLITAGALPWSFLILFYRFYFYPCLTWGGKTDHVFRTATVEPKIQAYRVILQHADLKAPIRIVAEGYWLAMPLRFVSGNDPKKAVVYRVEDSSNAIQALKAFLRTHHAEVVTYSGGMMERMLNPKDSIPHKIIYDGGHRRYLTVWQF